jgi:luciferase family oxidoreductase group 1
VQEVIFPVEFTIFDLTQAVTGKSHRETYDHLFEQAAIAEEGGIDAYYITEHHFDPGYSISPSPNVILGALTQRTSRIRLGTMTTVLPYHHPVRAAEEIRELDLLSGGRLDLAWGRGAIRHEQEGFGVPRNESSERFEETFHAVKRFLTEGKVDHYESRWWRGDNVVILPEATQKPHPPMWLTSVSETSAYKAGRLGLHCCTAFRSVDEIQVSIENYRAGWEDEHPDEPVGKYGSMNHIFVADTEEEARRLGQPHIDGWLDHFVAVLSDKPTKNEDPSYATHERVNKELLNSTFDQAVADNRVIFGTPDHCVEQLLKMAESGVDMFQGYFQFGELDYEASNRSLRLFCQEVMPRVKENLAAKEAAATK